LRPPGFCIGVLLFAGLAFPLEGQLFRGTSIEVIGGATELVLIEEAQFQNLLLRGAAYGAEGRLVIGWGELEGRYLASVLNGPRPGTGGDLHEGEAHGGVRVLPWMRIEGGARVRGLLNAAGTRRLVVWSMGGSVRAPLVRDIAWASGRYSHTIGGRSNARGAVERGRRVEVGLSVEPPGAMGFASVTYRLDRDNFVEGTRWTAAESAERIVVSLGLRVP